MMDSIEESFEGWLRARGIAEVSDAADSDESTADDYNFYSDRYSG